MARITSQKQVYMILSIFKYGNKKIIQRDRKDGPGYDSGPPQKSGHMNLLMESLANEIPDIEEQEKFVKYVKNGFKNDKGEDIGISRMISDFFYNLDYSKGDNTGGYYDEQYKKQKMPPKPYKERKYQKKKGKPLSFTKSWGNSFFKLVHEKNPRDLNKMTTAGIDALKSNLGLALKVKKEGESIFTKYLYKYYVKNAVKIFNSLKKINSITNGKLAYMEDFGSKLNFNEKELEEQLLENPDNIKRFSKVRISGNKVTPYRYGKFNIQKQKIHSGNKIISIFRNPEKYKEYLKDIGKNDIKIKKINPKLNQNFLGEKKKKLLKALGYIDTSNKIKKELTRETRVLSLMTDDEGKSILTDIARKMNKQQKLKVINKLENININEIDELKDMVSSKDFEKIQEKIKRELPKNINKKILSTDIIDTKKVDNYKEYLRPLYREFYISFEKSLSKNYKYLNILRDSLGGSFSKKKEKISKLDNKIKVFKENIDELEREIKKQDELSKKPKYQDIKNRLNKYNSDLKKLKAIKERNNIYIAMENVSLINEYAKYKGDIIEKGFYKSLEYFIKHTDTKGKSLDEIKKEYFNLFTKKIDGVPYNYAMGTVTNYAPDLKFKQIKDKKYTAFEYSTKPMKTETGEIISADGWGLV
jgi:hypothetical protein